jgi:hypothetical protein
MKNIYRLLSITNMATMRNFEVMSSLLNTIYIFGPTGGSVVLNSELN